MTSMIEPVGELSLSDFSTHSLRILQLARLECSANRNQMSAKIGPEHLLVAMLQDGDRASLGFELLDNCGLTIADLRSGNVKPRTPLS